MRNLFKCFIFSCAAFLLVPFCVAFEKVDLTPGNYTLQKKTRHYLTQDGTYHLTTNGNVVDALIEVKANISATIILNNCLIESSYAVYDYTAGATNSGYTNAALRICTAKPVELRFSGINKLTTKSPGGYPCQAIYAPPSNAATLMISKTTNAPAESSLYIRGNSSETSYNTNGGGESKAYTYPTINFSQKGKVILLSGNITIATTEIPASVQGINYYIPSLISTGTVELRGGTLTAQISPMRITNGLSASQCDKTSPLFDCATFVFSNGAITTAGDKEIPTSGTNVLTSTSKPYDTHYSYNEAKLTALTTASTQLLTGGEVRAKSNVYFYGFPKSSKIPTGCFAHSGNTALSDPKSDANGRITVSTSSYPELTRKYVNDSSKAIVEVFEAPVSYTEEGLRAEAIFGLSAITIDATTSQPVLTLALRLPDDTSSLSKTAAIQIFKTNRFTDEETLIADQLFTFTRATVDDPYFTATYTDDSNDTNSTSGSTSYTIKAYR